MAIKVDKITEFKVIFKKKQKPEKLLNTIFNFLGFKDTEIKLYKLLLNKELTINQIKKQMKVTERTIREHIKDLLKKQLIVRKAVSRGKRLKYVYSSVSVKKAWQIIKEQVGQTMQEADKIFSKIALLF